jgi:hypothetical protein
LLRQESSSLPGRDSAPAVQPLVGSLRGRNPPAREADRDLLRQSIHFVHQERVGDERCPEWLQTHRIELNAMTTPQFIEWLDRKMAENGGASKLIPPNDVVTAELETVLKNEVSKAATERILREAKSDQQIAKALKAIKRPSMVDLKKGIEKLFAQSPESEWRKHITTTVNTLVRKVR